VPPPVPEPVPPPVPEPVPDPTVEPVRDPFTSPDPFEPPVEAPARTPARAPAAPAPAGMASAGGRAVPLLSGTVSLAAQVPPGRFPLIIDIPAGAAELTFNTQTGRKIQAFDLAEVPDFKPGATAAAIRVRATTAIPPKFLAFDNGIVRGRLAANGRSIRFTSAKPRKRKNTKFTGDPNDPTPTR